MNTIAPERNFRREVIDVTPGKSNLESCLQCGTCGGSCPSGPDMDHTPRALFAMINAGMKDKVLKSNTPWYCVSCYACMVRCPQDVHITDLMYTLKRMAVKEGYYKEQAYSEAPQFSETFIEEVRKYGRSFELGLFTRFHLRHHPLDSIRMAPMGLAMLRKRRLNLKPDKIKNIKELHAILDKADKLGGAR
ncbi:MAG: 4Fe-4S dicluster domain-containing protein [Acidobacteriota bacterium]|nr:4Fe-4S dicluster domain-containing protein [Acidobacteriota bacterium]